MKISAARAVSLLALMVGTSLQVFATGIDYTCASNISTLGPSNTCAQLNSTIANLYNSSFSNANASIYIEYGNTGLGESTSGFLNLVSYSTYFNALTATASGNAIDVAALASLSSTEPSLYNGGDIELTSALAEALNITTAANGNAIEGTTDTGAVCTDPGSGSGINACYNGIITISRPANLPSWTDSSTIGVERRVPVRMIFSPLWSTRPTRFWDFLVHLHRRQSDGRVRRYKRLGSRSVPV